MAPFIILSLLPFLISPSLSSIRSCSSDQFCPPKTNTSCFIQLVYLAKRRYRAGPVLYRASGWKWN